MPDVLRLLSVFSHRNLELVIMVDSFRNFTEVSSWLEEHQYE